jgi:hypothetical protein
MEATYSSEIFINFTRLHSVTSQKAAFLVSPPSEPQISIMLKLFNKID